MFTGLAYGLARGSRGGLAVHHATAVLATREARQGQVVATVSSGSGGRRTIRFATPDASAPWVPGPFRQATRTSRLTGAGAEVLVETSPFSIGLARAGLSESPGFLDAELSWDGTGFSGAVANRTPYRLSEVAIVYGAGRVELGPLSPGASKPVQFTDQPAPAPGQLFDFSSSGGADTVLRDRLLASLRSLAGRGSMPWAPMVVGSTEDFRPTFSVDGRRHRPEGLTVIASPARIDLAPGVTGPVPGIAAPARLVRLDGNASFEPAAGFLSLDSFREAVFAFRAPVADPGRIGGVSLSLTAAGPGLIRTEAFDFARGEWTALSSLDVSKSEPIGQGAALVGQSLPATVVSEAGEVYVRLAPEREPFLQLWSLDLEVNLL